MTEAEIRALVRDEIAKYVAGVEEASRRRLSTLLAQQVVEYAEDPSDGAVTAHIKQIFRESTA